MPWTADVPAKINLYLKVFDRRPDGFHGMQTVMLKVGFYDRLTLDVAEGDAIALRVSGAPELEGQDNLVVRAARAYLTAAGARRSVAFTLEKNIFMGAGLGGGSADAAHALRLLDQALGAVPRERLGEIAADLGSDVPVFLTDDALAFACGRGERVVPWGKLPPRWLVIAHPGFGVATKDAYAALARPMGADEGGTRTPGPPRSWDELAAAWPMHNDFQDPIEAKFPRIREMRRALLESGASASMMTGSGAAAFGWFKDEAAARQGGEGMRTQGYRAVAVQSL